MSKRKKTELPNKTRRTDAPQVEPSKHDASPTPDASRSDALPASPPPWFSIVAIGASAGGLEAIRTLFQNMAPDSGAAFVIVQHLSPDFKSMMAEIVQHSTTMKVRQAEDGLRVEPNRVYTNVPGKDLLIEDGSLRLAEPDMPRGRRLPIDRFFRSLAEDRQENVICILLSGTGSDGTLGLKTVKGLGGIAIAQEGDAKYQDMPQHAIASGLVDYVLKADDMPAKILELLKNRPCLPREADGAPETQEKDASIKKILRRLKLKTGHDFSLYKHNTIVRRIERRMVLLQLREAREYEAYIKLNDAELKSLFQELLIGVTNFFRDPESFEILGKTVIPQLFAGKTDGDVIRVWVAGCSTGEEAYSVAILLDEYMRASSRMNRVQIFATDIDGESLEFARSGLYSPAIEADVSPKRLARYFTKDGGGYKIIKSVRETLIFAPHSLIKDPPYSHMDLIICRNLLIYLGNELQKKVLPLFHYSLNPNGFLFLGPSESAAEHSTLFIPVDRRWKIFQRKGDLPGRLVDMPMPPVEEVAQPQAELRPAQKETYARQAEQLLLSQFTPAGVIVNDQYEPRQFFGPVDRYFKVSAGESTRSVLLLAREDLRLHLRAVIRAAVHDGRQVRREDLTLQTEGNIQKINLVVTPLKEDAKLGRLFLVVFEHVGWGGTQTETQRPSLPADGAAIVAALEEELKSTKTQLQTTVEELESSNEELKSSNEELKSMNEELQSSNEELETSREELHSINEELTTVNTEMQHKVEELGKANSDLQNLMNSTRIATLFLDRDLVIRRFTAQVAEFFNILDVDLGRPFSHLRSKIEYAEVLEDFRQVLADLTPVERQLHVEGDRWIIVRIMPYRTEGDQIGGVVMTLLDVSQLRFAEQQLTERTAELESLYRAIPDIYLRIGPDDRILGARAWSETDLIPDPNALIGQGLYAAFPGSSGQDLERAVREVRDESAQRSVDLHVAEGGTERFLEARILPAQGEVYVILRDMTDLRLAEERVRFQADALAQVSDGLIAVNNEGVVNMWNPGAEKILGIAAMQAMGRSLEAVTGTNWLKAGDEAAQKGDPADKWHWVEELEHIRADGRKVLIESSVSVIRDRHDKKVGLLSVLRDVSERKRFERELLEAKQAAEAASQAKSEFLANMSHEIRTPLNGIMGMTDLVLDTELADKQRTYLSGVKDSAASLAAIINDILDFSKIEARKLELSDQPFDLAQVLDSTIKSFRFMAEAKGVALAASIIPGVPTLLDGDPVRLKQILVNLVGNAIKFTDKGAIDIQVGTLDLTQGPEARLKNRNGERRVRLLFSVRDTGVGIPLESQQSIFDMFAQGDSGTTKQYGGTGLGLTITRNLVELMQGHIWVVSREGQGSTFFFNVLFKEQSPRMAQALQKASPSKLEPLKILLAEDNTINRMLAEDLLRKAGHTVSSVTDGQAALDALEGEPFDVVLMDISMPRMDGIEATRRIRASASGRIDPQIGIIALTAHAFEEDKERVLAAGMDGYIAKPIDMLELNRILHLVLKGR